MAVRVSVYSGMTRKRRDGGWAHLHDRVWLRRSTRICAGVALLARLAAADPARAGDVILRNCVDPALLTTHEITTTLVRATRRKDATEESVLEIRSRLVRAHLDESQPGQVKVAAMLVTGPAKVVSLKRDGKPVTPVPAPDAFNLPSGATVLKTLPQTFSDGPVVAPSLGPVEGAMAAILLDVAHWPRGGIGVGDSWERPVQRASLDGTQRFTLIQTAQIERESVAVVEMAFSGAFSGDLAEAYRIDEIRARYVWARADRVLVRLGGQARYHRVRDNEVTPHLVNVEVALKQRDRLSEEQQEPLRTSLTDFANALSESQADRPEKVVTACALFREKWPSSVWMPAVDELDRKALRQIKPAGRLPPDALTMAVTELAMHWQAAQATGDEDLEARTQRSLRQLVEEQDGGIRAMMKGADVGQRALGVFAWSFGESPSHYAKVVEALGDKSPRVRAWAANGIAARRDPSTDPATLRRLLADDDATVRAKGCLAVARCLPAGEPPVGRLRDALLALLQDAEKMTRLEAARALGVVGAADEVAALRAAREKETDDDCIKALDRAIDRAGKRRR